MKSNMTRDFYLLIKIPVHKDGLRISAPFMDFQAWPILQICIQVMMALRQIHQFLAQKWLNEQEKHLFVIISKILLSQFVNTLSQNRDIGALEGALLRIFPCVTCSLLKLSVPLVDSWVFLYQLFDYFIHSPICILDYPTLLVSSTLLYIYFLFYLSILYYLQRK